MIMLKKFFCLVFLVGFTVTSHAMDFHQSWEYQQDQDPDERFSDNDFTEEQEQKLQDVSATPPSISLQDKQEIIRAEINTSAPLERIHKKRAADDDQRPAKKIKRQRVKRDEDEDRDSDSRLNTDDEEPDSGEALKRIDDFDDTDTKPVFKPRSLSKKSPRYSHLVSLTPAPKSTAEDSGKISPPPANTRPLAKKEPRFSFPIKPTTTTTTTTVTK